MSEAKIKPLNFKQSGLNENEWKILKKLKNPEKIQDFLDSLRFNFERRGETHFSVRYSLKRKKAHCFEGALLAALALWMQGRRPLLMDLVTIRPDFDHIVTLFKKDGYWGAISKTNHAVLRYRDPIYRNIRELALSYFHEYFLGDGKKTLRKYSKPFDLSRCGTYWITTSENLAELAHIIDSSPHTRIFSPKQTRGLRKADKVERRVSNITEWKR